MSVLVPIADGSEEIETVCIVDTLVRAGAKVTLASVTDSLSVVCSRGVKITADTKISGECAEASLRACWTVHLRRDPLPTPRYPRCVW